MSTAYPIYGITVPVILFYLLSAAFVRMGLISKVSHRKFWNVLLLITFLVTGLIGLTMVIKINYKLEIPYYESLMGYHVEFGIGMAIIGFIHFLWHFNYYLRLFLGAKRIELRQIISIENNLDEQVLKISAFLLGCTTIIAQIVLLREFLSVFDGNELVIGMVLANWMALTGVGAFLGKHPLRIIKASKVIIPGLLILSILPFITTLLTNFLKNRIFPVGAMISLFQIFFASLFLLVPFCLLSGFLFTFISKCNSEIRNQNETGPVYGYESFGSITGGLLSGLLFIFIFSSAESLMIPSVINGLALFLISLKTKLIKLARISLLVAITAIAIMLVNPEKLIRSWVYPNQEIVVSKDSPYGNIVITRRENLWSVYNNNILMFDSENFMLNEEAVHFAMVQHPDPKNILLVSGGLSGQIAEIMKYKPVSVDDVEENRWLLTIMQDSLKKIFTGQIRLHATEPNRFIRNSKKLYDVAILNLPGPSTLQANRYYTLEFFIALKGKLSEGGVLSFGLPAPVNYLNNEAVKLNSTIFATLKKVFPNVMIIPGEKNYFLASNVPLTYNIAQNVRERGIPTRYVNQNYFNDILLKSRGLTILSSLNPDSDINLNMKPLLYRQQLAYWLSYFKEKYWMLAVLMGFLGLFTFFSGSIPSKAMFLTGFSASGIEILLLFGLQVYFGNIYLITSFVFTSFMIGLAFGSIFGKSLKSRDPERSLAMVQVLIGAFTAAIALCLFSPGLANLPPAIVYSLYFVATLIMGWLTGIQFTGVTLISEGGYAEISGSAYSYDLFGSAFGALVVTLYLVPKTSIVASVLAISFLNILFGIYLTLRKN